MTMSINPPAGPMPATGRQSRATTFATIAALALFVLPAASGCSKETSSTPATSSSSSDPVVARVNGTEIHESDVQMASDDLGENAQNLDPDAKREQIVGYLTDVTLIAQEAQKKNLQNDADFKRRESFLRNKLLMGMLLQSETKAAITDEEMHKVYDDAMASMTNEEEVRARHILVETEDEAKAILEQLKAGADFATLAKEKSKDPGAADGGDLGYFNKGQMVPEFSEVAFKMYPGQLSNPVKTQFGWHIIKLEDKRQRKPPPFDAVKDQLAEYVARRAQTAFVTKLRERAKIERLDKPPVQSAPSMPMAPPPGDAR